MQRRRFWLALLPLLLATGPAKADLKAFFAKPEPLYKWEKTGEQKMGDVTVYDIHLVSQEWQGKPWEHHVQLFRPDKLDHPDFCTIYNTGGSGSAGNTAQGIRFAQTTGCNYAILFNIPNQPLYGKTEDALIVETWLKFMQTGDESWPLHFPMAKSVLKCMDCIQEFSKQQKLPEINRFIINGGSKRGWTTWLAGASQDKRIKAIAPMVIDVLNVPKQAAHQLEAWGKPSEQVADYTVANIQQLLSSERGRRLMELEDPYSYRDILTLPKLLMFGTNDRYWTQDALNIYWDDLKGPKWVIYVPNSGHGLEDRDRVVATLSAFVRMIASGKRWPTQRWQYLEQGPLKTLMLSSDMPIKEGRLFHVEAKTQDFRDSKWSFEPMEKSASYLRGSMEHPSSGYRAIFGEAVYELEPGKPFTLSTQMSILGPGK